jgi:hypothetical protein
MMEITAARAMAQDLPAPKKHLFGADETAL